MLKASNYISACRRILHISGFRAFVCFVFDGGGGGGGGGGGYIYIYIYIYIHI